MYNLQTTHYYNIPILFNSSQFFGVYGQITVLYNKKKERKNIEIHFCLNVQLQQIKDQWKKERKEKKIKSSNDIKDKKNQFVYHKGEERQNCKVW